MSEDVTPPAVPASGEMIGGKYRVEEVLGIGGMGVVLLATHVLLNEKVALKLIRPAVNVTPTSYERFFREARIASRIRSEHVARVFDLGTTDGGLPFIVMEFLRGRDLASEIAVRGALPAGEVAELVLQAAEGVAEAHALGVVHRDLKPANLFLARRSDGRTCVKVLDFGISKMVDPRADALWYATTLGDADGAPSEPAARSEPADAGTPPADHDSLTRSRAKVGSPQYMAPEQITSARAVDARADIWGLGVILYESLTATLPFEGASLETLHENIAYAKPAPLPAAVPEGMASVVEACLRKKPGERPLDVAAVASLLAPFVSDGQERARRIRRILSDVEEAPGLESAASGRRTEATAPGRARLGRWLALAAATFAVGAVGVGGAVRWASHRHSSLAAQREPTNPLAAANSRLACPILEVHGVPEPSAWLGAAAGNALCRRGLWYLDGLPWNALPPGVLLDLPRWPANDLADPYLDPAARERSLAAARSSDAAAILDGSITVDGSTFVLDVALRRRDGSLVGEAQGRSEYLEAATKAVLEHLESVGALRPRPLAPEVVAFSSAPDARTGLLMQDIADWTFDRSTCEAIAARGGLIAKTWLGGGCAEALGRPPVVAELDRSSKGALRITAPSYAKRHPEEAPALAKEMAAYLAAEPTLFGRVELSIGLADLSVLSREVSPPLDAVRAAVKASPGDETTWRALGQLSKGELEGKGLARVNAIWRPNFAQNWEFWAAYESSDEEKARYYERYDTLRPSFGHWQTARLLLRLGRYNEAREIAARDVSSPETFLMGALVLARIDASDAHFAAAISNIDTALRDHDYWSRVPDSYIFGFKFELAEIVGRRRELDDAWIREALVEHPIRLDTASSQFLLIAMKECLRASGQWATVCFDTLAKNEATVGSHDGWSASPMASAIEGGRLYVQGNVRGALRAWRPVVASNLAYVLPPEPFDAIGDHEAATKIDSDWAPSQAFRGISSTLPREAERSLAAGDVDKAREQAQRVIDAWSVADVEIPAVAKMRALLRRTEHRR